MSTNDGSDDGDDGGPGRREVAHRIFAAEFDDASLSYSESDEERAPNYVVTPTGARVNRLFAVGVLTEVDAVNEETLRARIADPTGAFVSYAGQYQPDEMAFLDRTTPPAFLALTGKARTFEPEDSDRVFTSVRPESINEVDGDTRDRWVVETARATLRRVRVFADALETGLTGEDLRAHLESHDVPVSLASGIPLAIDHYGTTTAYLEAVRTLAVETLEVVADEREEATRLNLAPGEGGEVDLGPLPASESDLSIDAVAAVDETTETPETDEAEDIVDAEATTGASSDTTDSVTASVTDDESDGTTDSEATAATTEETDPVEATDSGESSEAASTTDSIETGEPTETTETPGDDLGDFDAGGSTASADSESDEESDAGVDTSDDDTDDVDPEDLDEVLDDETREAVESEYGVDFSTGNEVDDPGEADIDVPDADDLEEMTAQAEGGAASTDADSAEETASSPDESESDAEADEAESADEADGTQDEETTDAADLDAEDVDLESAVVEAMKAEDGGDGAPREDVIAAVVAEYGVAESAVEDAVQDALMSGLCYEAGDGLKPI